MTDTKRRTTFIQQTLDPEEDLFPERPSPVVTARRQCDACDLTYVVALEYAGPPFCDGCRADMDGTKARIRRDLESEQAQERDALAAWDAIREARQAAWDKIQDSRDLPDYATRCAEHVRKQNVYGRLLEAEQAYETELTRLGAERARLEKALEALS